MATEPISVPGDTSWPYRKAHASLSAVEKSVLEALMAQHPELADSEGNYPSLVQLQHDLADHHLGAQRAQELQ